MTVRTLYILAIMALMPTVMLRAQEPASAVDTAKVPHVSLDLDLFDSEDETVVNEIQTPAKPSKPSRKELKEQSKTWDDLYLDTVEVKRKNVINDYTMIGVQYGAALSDVLWNPYMSHKMTFIPYNFGVMYTRYGKMFGFMPYFGIQVGLFYTKEGYAFKYDEDNDYTPILDDHTRENSATMNVLELPVLAHCHVDFWKMKVLINVGCFAGYRLSINRFGDNVREEDLHSFRDYNNRVDWGLKGGAGFAFVFDPVEIHLQATYKQSLSSLYKPDYRSEYYYRFAYPNNIIVSVGLHFQLTKRTGKTTHQIKQEAKERINNEIQGNTDR